MCLPPFRDRATTALPTVALRSAHHGRWPEPGRPKRPSGRQLRSYPVATVTTAPISRQDELSALAGPSCVTGEAIVAELNPDGSMTVLRPGTNEWTCMPGDQNVVGATDMCADPMGMVWIMDLMAGKPKPSNTSPGLIYMLNGATQHSFTDPSRISPEQGPHEPDSQSLQPSCTPLGALGARLAARPKLLGRSLSAHSDSPF